MIVDAEKVKPWEDMQELLKKQILKKLESEQKAWADTKSLPGPFYAKFLKQIIDLLHSQSAEIARLRGDAQRYRWLRECQSIPADILLHHHDALDDAIDAAMAFPHAEDSEGRGG